MEAANVFKVIFYTLINNIFRSRTVYNQMVSELRNSKVNHESPLNIDKIKTKALLIYFLKNIYM